MMSCDCLESCKKERNYLKESRIHIHVIKAENECKYWLEPDIELAENFGFSSKELSYIEKILRETGDDFKYKFTRYVGKRLDDQR